MLSRDSARAAEVIDLSRGLSLHDLALSAAFGSHCPTDRVMAAVLELAHKNLIRWTREPDYGNVPGIPEANIEADLAWVKAAPLDPKAIPAGENPTLFIEPTPSLASELVAALEVYGSILTGQAGPDASPNGGQSLEQIEGAWETPDGNSTGLVLRCHAARKKPIDQLSNLELATLLDQSIGVEHILPEAVLRVAQNQPDDTEYFEGQLKEAVERTQPKD